MRRFFVIIGVFLAICFLISGCGSSEEPFQCTQGRVG